jgi:hypothetical protein
MHNAENNKKTVYIMVGNTGEPYSPNGVAAAQGFTHIGYDVQYFTKEEMSNLPLTPETIVVAGIGTTHAAFAQIGVRPPVYATIPACLYPYVGREIWRSTLSEVHQTNNFPVFVKPYEDMKTFTGRVVNSSDELDALTAARPGSPEVPPDFPLLCQTPVKFLSEWRVFIAHEHVLGISQYQGDPFTFPNPNVMRLAIAAYTNAPAGYCADFGVLASGETVLVEVNDGYSLGNAGLLGSLYAELLRARWVEIMQS